MLRFTFFLSAFLAFVVGLIPANSLANNNDPVITAAVTCDPPPAPTAFNITSTTTTSISLSWSSPGAPVFQVSTQDLTVPTSIPDANGSGNAVTISGLQPGHSYLFTLKTAYAVGCPWSPTVNKGGSTSVIIIDVAAGLQSPCSPTGGNLKASGSTETVCVNRFYSNNANVATIKVAIDGNDAYFNVVYDIPNQLQEPKMIIDLVASGLSSTEGYDMVEGENGKARLTYGGTDVMLLEGGYYEIGYGNIVLSFLKPTTLSTCRSGCTRTRSDESGDEAFAFVKPTLTPNPFSNTTTINYQLEKTTVVQIQVFDAMGRLVQTPQTQATLPEGPQTATVDGAGLPNGVYFVVLQTDGQRQLQRLVKQE